MADSNCNNCDSKTTNHRNLNQLEAFFEAALQEDLKENGDVSSLASIPATTSGSAKLLVKENGILAGVELAKRLFKFLDPTTTLEPNLTDGARVSIGDVALKVHGSVHNLLKGERLMLNCMQRMSGIASLTALFVEKTTGTTAKILDTRKTIPNLRFIEKWAVRIGGGHNHRFGLYDMVMLKDNHIDFCGGITKAVDRTVEYLAKNQLDIPIEVETRSLADVAEVLDTGKVDRVMFDNFSVEQVNKGVSLVNGRIETEVSGGITLETIRPYAECNPDFISVGAITHSAVAMDLSFKAVS